MSAAKKEKPVLSLRGALREKFAAPEWAYFEEVRNGTGWSRSVTRTADALAFGLWPSRGLELHGIEIKSARSDWKNELANPAKAEEIGRFCDRWWLVTEEKVAHIEEIPPAWGWLVFDGKKLKMMRDAPKREAQPIDRAMLAAILRKASESIDDVVREHVDERVRAKLEKERTHHAEQVERLISERSEYYRKANRTGQLLHHFTRAFGVELADDATDLPDELTERLKLLAGADLKELRADLANAANKLRAASTAARSMLRAAGVRSNKDRWGWQR